MSHHILIQTTLRVELIRVTGDDDPRPSTCLRCAAELDVIQPDPGDPDRLIGACIGCGSWFVIDWPEGDSLAEIMELPRLGTARQGPPLAALWPEDVAERAVQAGA